MKGTQKEKEMVLDAKLFQSFVMVSSEIELIFFVEACMMWFWIFDENKGDSTQMFLLLPSGTYAEPRIFLLLMLPCQRAGWGCTKSWERTQPGPRLTQDAVHTIWHHAQQQKLQ